MTGSAKGQGGRRKPSGGGAPTGEATQKTGGKPSKTRRPRPKAGRKPSKAKKRRPARAPDPSDTEDAETRFIQPYEATKTYLCPGCNRDIPPGLGHMVAIPPGDPDLRRHWHRGCWNNRSSRQ